MVQYLLRIVVAGLLMCPTAVRALSNTGGTPIGGMGTGYVKYNARSGDFAASGKAPPAASDQINEFQDKKSASCGFHFFAGGKSVRKARTNNEDAKFPLYRADFDDTNTIKFSLQAFGPFVPGDNPLYYQLATSPLAYFEITAENTGAAAMEVAVAMEFANRSATRNLLGGADTGVIVTASGNRAISFPGDTIMGNAYLTLECSGQSPLYSAGAFGDFLTNGTLANTDGNLVAAKCRIPPEGKVRFKFTLAWWRSFVSASDRYGSGKNDEDNYYYHNFYSSSKGAAEFGAQNFDLVRNGVVTMVNRVMGSNFPEWYNERLLNNLYPMVQNSVCAEDGRTAFWEGSYPVIGTIDQAQHAALWYVHTWPQNQWLELQYWIRTAYQGVGEEAKLKGQIHHDFNMGPIKWTPESRFMCPWDNFIREDYWFLPKTTDWADLNVMAIFKAYELMLATGNLDSMEHYFPKLLLTAERLLTMCSDAGKKLPVKSKSTYDYELDVTPQYASGIALVAFLAMEEMAKFVGDTVAAPKYRDWYTAARAEFKAEIYNSEFCSIRNFAEGDIAGYSWGNYFCLEPVMDADIVNEGCKRLSRLYSGEPGKFDKLGSWHFYTCDHWGGAEITRGSPDTAMNMFKSDYDYYHKANPSFVFWQDLWTANDVYASYVTAPSVWRSYFQMTGYLLDNANKRLWIRPKVPTAMNKRIVNAPLINAKGWGTLNYDESGDSATQPVQRILVTFDSAVAIRELVLKNNTGGSTPFICIDDNVAKIDTFKVATEDWGIEKNIRISFATPVVINHNGLNIQVYSHEVGTIQKHNRPNAVLLAIVSRTLQSGRPVVFTVDRAGEVTIDLLSLNGARIGNVMRRTVSASGTHSFVWNGSIGDGRRVASKIVLMRIVTPSGSICRKMVADIK